MTARAKLEANDRREAIFASAGYRCEVCRMPVRRFGTAQLAHRIPATVAWLAKYGARVIHHPRNMASVCGLKCNSSVLIGNNPVERERLAAEIVELLEDVDEIIQGEA